MAELSSAVGRAFFGRFKSLSAVQHAALDPVLTGRHTLIRSATASGKTEAAMAPIVQRYLTELNSDAGTIVIAVSPTRALVNDLHRRLEVPLEQLGLRVGVRHGERDDLSRVNPPHILVTTPESFDIIVGRRVEALKHSRCVLIDEAHLLFNTQRGVQAAISLARLEQWSGREMQLVGLSATIASAVEVGKFFCPDRQLVDVRVTGGRPLDHRIRLDVSETDLMDVLRRVSDGKVLVFSNSRSECDRLADRLRSTKDFGDDVYVHHSSLSGDERQRTEARFAACRRGVCVATPTLELGIDIGSIDLVVLYGAPPTWQSFAQRVGRGNRRSERIEALLCVPSTTKDAIARGRLSFQALIYEATDTTESGDAAAHLYGAVAQQLCSEIAARGAFVGVNALTSITERWLHLNAETVIEILDELVEAGILTRHPVHHRYGPTDGLHELEERWEIWSNFTGTGRQVPIMSGGKELGRASNRSLASLKVGDVVLQAGRRVRVERIDHFGVHTKSTSAAPTATLRHEGAAIESSPTLADSVRRVLINGSFTVGLSSRDAAALLAEFQSAADVLAAGKVPVVRSGGWCHYLTFAGSVVNELLYRRIPDAGAFTGVVLSTRATIDWSTIPRSLSELVESVSVPIGPVKSGFQDRLPHRLQEIEARSVILANGRLHEILERLHTSDIEFIDDLSLLRLFPPSAGPSK